MHKQSRAQAPDCLGCLEYEKAVASHSHVLLNGQTIQQQDKGKVAGANPRRRQRGMTELLAPVSRNIAYMLGPNPRTQWPTMHQERTLSIP